MKRRDFFKIVTTSGAAAAVAGCQQSAERILPLVVPNEQIVPGVATYFATVCRECPAGCGVLARNRDGRVVKLEGNPDHPVNQGALCVRGQAALQQIYHPDRFTGPQRRDGDALKAMPWDEALKLVADKAGELRKAGKGRATAIVAQLENGSQAVRLDRWVQGVGARPRVTFEPFGYEAIRAANHQVFGRDVVPYYAFEDAEVVLSFGADFIETWLSNVGYARSFARSHGFAGGRAGTFIHVEPRQSVTASNADHWVRNAPGTEGLVALAVLKSMVDQGLVDRRFAEAVAAVNVEKTAEASGVSAEAIKQMAQMFGHAKPGLAVGGGAAVTGTNATATQTAINLLNAATGAIGKTVRFGPDAAWSRVTPFAEVAQLVQAMAKGEVELLLLGPGVNPAFTLPGGLKFADAARKVPLVASFANQPDETTALAHVVLPANHWLESWGDYSPREGVVGLMQPAMSPIRDSLPFGDALLRIGRGALGAEEGKGPLPWPTFQAYLTAQWEPLVKDKWAAALHPGAVAIPIGHRYSPFHRRYVTPAPTTMNPVSLLGGTVDPASGGLAYLGVKVTLAKTGARRPLAILQATHDQDDRELVREVDLAAAREQALRGKPGLHEPISMYPDQQYPGYRWGMVIDTDLCVGCSACMAACQAENNVAVVGKPQAAYGRQLHWIRVERWAEGTPEHPQNTFLPMLCQHCEVAPCEPVCPVFAAYRTDEGLNGQVYNRCVGTRYCGNNCPYHVRRFNWYNWEWPEPLEVQLNPDVTVRQLGVMEKCTMCIQRIVAGKDHARDEKRSVRDGDILTACQQTCPTRAITFGNIKDDKSDAAKLRHSPRAYQVLDELGTRPSVIYLKKVVRGEHA